MVFVKHQVQEISGNKYEYWYLYESYYNPSMNNPTNFKVGKVGDDTSSDDDLRAIRDLKHDLADVDLELLESVIIADNSMKSMRKDTSIW